MGSRRRSFPTFMMMVMVMTMRCVAPATYILEDRAKSGTPHTSHFYQMWIDSRASRTSTGVLIETRWQLTFLLHIHSRALRTPQQNTSRLNLHWHRGLILLYPPQEISTTIDPPYNPPHSDDAIPKTPTKHAVETIHSNPHQPSMPTLRKSPPTPFPRILQLNPQDGSPIPAVPISQPISHQASRPERRSRNGERWIVRSLQTRSSPDDP